MERVILMKYRSLIKNVDGQMIILAGFFVGVAIVALTILLNQIILSGYQVSKSELDDTKYSLSSLRAETIRTIKRASFESWKNVNKDSNNTANLSDVKSTFISTMNNFSAQIPRIYRQYGKIVNVTKFNPVDFDSENYINNVSFEMTYTDGVNSYYATVFLENIRLTMGVYGNDKGTHVRRVLLAYADPMVVNSSGIIPVSVTNITVRVTDEIGNPIPNGDPVNFTIVEDPSGNPAPFLGAPGVHGYLIKTPSLLSPPLLNYSAIPDGNGQINIFYVHNCGGNDGSPKKAVLVETSDGPYGPVPPVTILIMGGP